jgi:hypothetical protein
MLYIKFVILCTHSNERFTIKKCLLFIPCPCQEMIAFKKPTFEDLFKRDLLSQALAELSLYYIDSEFPAHIVLNTNISNNEPALISSTNTIIQQAREQVSNIARRGTSTPVYPTLAHDQEYINNHVTDKPSIKDNITVGNIIDNTVYISRAISQGTSQGTVYETILAPNENMVYLHQFDQAIPIRAIVKKSPIYNVKQWFQYIDGQGDMDVLVQQYNDLNNPAYVDALGNVICSSLVQNGLSCFFALCYGTMRAYDTAYFSKKEVLKHGPEINHNFPVQLTFIQPLHGSLADLSQNKWFLQNSSFASQEYSIPILQDIEISYFDCKKCLAVFAQIVFGLSLVQKMFSLVLNDLHMNNILYENVPFDTTLFYYQQSTGNYYAVPSYGKVFKMIDFGRAYFRIGVLEFQNRELNRFFREPRYWDVSNKNNDLVRIVNNFIINNRDDILASDIVPEQDVCLDTLLAFFDHVLTCKSRNKRGDYNIINEYDTCIRNRNANLIKQASTRALGGIVLGTFAQKGRYELESEKNQRDCNTSVLAVQPFANDSGCNNGTPSQNIRFFDMFRIHALPSCARLVFLID